METTNKSFIRSVVNPTDEMDTMRVLACKAKDGWSFYIQRQKTVVKGKKSSTTTSARGASARYQTFDEAHAAVLDAIQKLVAAGWTEVVPKAGGFRAAADAFSLDKLPAPPVKK